MTEIRKIHPYDMYIIMMKDKNSSVRDLKETVELPVYDDNGVFLYNSQGYLMAINGEKVIQTTTVKPETTEII